MNGRQALGPGRLAVDARILERDPAQVVPPEAGAVTIIVVLPGLPMTARHRVEQLGAGP
jgi:hypothetical protein